MVRIKNYSTSNREIYEKFNMLKISSEIIIREGIDTAERIVRRINKDKKILDVETIGKYIIIKKINPIDFNIYMKTPKR